MKVLGSHGMVYSPTLGWFLWWSMQVRHSPSATRIITSLVGDPFKPSLTTVTGRGIIPNIPHRIHGSYIFTYIDPIKINHSCRYTYIPYMDPMGYKDPIMGRYNHNCPRYAPGKSTSPLKINSWKIYVLLNYSPFFRRHSFVFTFSRGVNCQKISCSKSIGATDLAKLAGNLEAIASLHAFRHRGGFCSDKKLFPHRLREEFQSWQLPSLKDMVHVFGRCI